jgi:hypothetical protein
LCIAGNAPSDERQLGDAGGSAGRISSRLLRCLPQQPEGESADRQSWLGVIALATAIAIALYIAVALAIVVGLRKICTYSCLLLYH